MPRKNRRSGNHSNEMRAVIYARYSSHKQTEQSIEGQLAECYKYVAKNGYTVVDEYIDRETSGTTASRPQFQRMISDSTSGEFGTVLIYEFDRFARNRRDSSMYKSILKHNGVNVISVTQTIPDTPEGIILEACLEGMDEYYSADLSRKTSCGMAESAKKGMSTGSYLPLGYAVDQNKQYYINEQEAVLVRKAFALYADDVPVKDICSLLTEWGLRTRPSKKSPQGRPISPSVLAYMITNRRYAGINEFNGKEYPFPVIVDNETFEICQQRNERMRIRTGCPNSAAKTNYALVGKAVCSRCGKPIIGDSGRGRMGEPHYYYACSTRKKHASACRLKRFRKEELENLVLSATRDDVLTVDNIISIADYTSIQNQPDTSLLYTITARQQENETAIQNLLRAIEMGLLTPSTKSRLDQLESEKIQLSQSAAQERMRLSAPDVTREHIIFFLDSCRQALTTDDSLDGTIVKSLVNQIIVNDDDIVIVYNYKKTSERISLQSLALTGSVGGFELPSEWLPW